MPDPTWINGVSFDAEELRRADAANLTAGAGRALGARSGVRPGNGDAVSLSGSTVTVHDVVAVIDATLGGDGDGPYRVGLTESTLALAPADGSNPRIDLVVLRVYDDALDLSGRDEAVPELVAGAPSATPSAPAVPSGAVVLGQVSVPQSGGGAASLTYTAPRAVASGGVTPARDDADRPGATYDGLLVWREDTHVLEVFNDGTWQALATLTPPGVTRQWDVPSRASLGTAEVSFTSHGTTTVVLSPGTYHARVSAAMRVSKGAAVANVAIDVQARVSVDGGTTWTTAFSEVAADAGQGSASIPVKVIKDGPTTGDVVFEVLSRRTDSATGTVNFGCDDGYVTVIPA